MEAMHPQALQSGRRGKLADYFFRHGQFRKILPQDAEILNYLPALAGFQYFGQLIPDPGIEQAEPHFLDLCPRRPELEKVP
jgi:hypothetical protein